MKSSGGNFCSTLEETKAKRKKSSNNISSINPYILDDKIRTDLSSAFRYRCGCLHGYGLKF